MKSVHRSPFTVHLSPFGGAGTVHTEHGKVNARESWFGRRAETEEEKIDQRFDSVHRHGSTDVRNDLSAIRANGSANRAPNAKR